MKILTAVIVTGLLAMSASISAQRSMRGMSGPAMYDPSTEVTLTGTVTDVQHMQAPGRGEGGIHLVLSAQSGAMTVHVGPASYVKSKEFTFEKGDALTITGSKVTMAGEAVVLAREISKAGRTLTLRSDKGFPMWSGRMSRP